MISVKVPIFPKFERFEAFFNTNQICGLWNRTTTRTVISNQVGVFNMQVSVYGM